VVQVSFGSLNGPYCMPLYDLGVDFDLEQIHSSTNNPSWKKRFKPKLTKQLR